MKMSQKISACLLAAAAFLFADSDLFAGGSKVVLQKNINGEFQLLRNGSPYQVKGAGGTSHFEKLAAAGGNSIRTWGVEGLRDILDAAEKNGLTVCVGLWLEHERHGFNYGDQASVQAQQQKCLDAVRKFKDHPAVLLWGIGNEMEGERRDSVIWKAVNDIAKRVQQIDPDHPTMTVIAELGAEEYKLRAIEEHCPHIDIVGVNSYGGIPTVAARYRKANSTKPYIVTEHGPIGPWETAKTPWGSPIEVTSTEKAEWFASGYRLAVLEQPESCLGSYAFLWGNKQETTATWFGMLLPDGTRLAAVDAMSELWTGKPPRNRCPEIQSIQLQSDRYLKPGSQINASVVVKDPEGDAVTVKWVLTVDSKTIGVGGDAQEREAELEDSIEADGANVRVTLPMDKGAYRLFAYVYDDQGGAAVANRAIKVEDAAKTVAAAPSVKLPFAVLSDKAAQEIFSASGYMGNSAAVKMDLSFPKGAYSGATCLKAEYQANGDWGGVLWQSPANDWEGKKPGGANLTGATAIEFWARGEHGGEVVNFVYGVVENDEPYRDTSKGELPNVKLSKQWTKYKIPLTGKDLSRIKTAFGWSLAGQGEPVTFYLDDIVYVE